MSRLGQPIPIRPFFLDPMRVRAFCVILLLAGLFVAGVFWLFPKLNAMWLHENAAAHAKANTLNDLRRIAYAMIDMANNQEMDGMLLSDKNMVIMRGDKLYEVFELWWKAGHEPPLYVRNEWREGKCVMDSYGRPIHVRMVHHGNTLSVRVWSDGPDHVDNYGGLDDILFSINDRGISDFR